MDELTSNFINDFLNNLFLYFTVTFFGLFLLLIIIGVIDHFYGITDKLFKTTMIILAITGIITLAINIIISTNDNNISVDKLRNTYNIEQHDDELNFTKKPEVKNFAYKDKVNYKITKEIVTNNYNNKNETIKESEEEHYILTDTYNNKKTKLNKEQLKQLISYTKNKEEKFNIDDLKS